jgi:predicted ATPase/DNA-binding SARP family transcriptional activator
VGLRSAYCGLQRRDVEVGATEFRLLGPLEVVDDGRPVALGSPRQRSLLAVLLLHANSVVSGDLLIEALWAGRPTATAGNALQVQVHALRKRLGPTRVATAGPGYRLQVEPGELDLEVFEDRVLTGRNELAVGSAEAAAETFREALALWRGEALADVAYEPFAQSEIARLDELKLAALEERIQADLALARQHDLVPELEALVLAHPSRERLHGQLMLALYRTGRQTKALEVFQSFRSELRETLGLEPGPELRELQQAILRHDATLRVEAPELRARRHLPAPRAELVGRRNELEEVGTLLRSGIARMVTLTGPGGTGKTRLAQQVAHGLADAFADGVYFVDLSHLSDPALVPSAMADSLGLEEQGDEPLPATVQTHLRHRQVLLLLDNFEVVDEAAPLLADLLGVAPDLSLLVTSRAPLRLSGEHQYRVRPLPLRDAVQLFAARSRAVAPGFRRPGEEAEEVSRICRRLDCLPLAIELAAARTREYSPTEMLDLLPGRLELASGGARDLPSRQRTLRAAIEWSYELLDDEQRAVFARVAVFSGGCTVTTAQDVCGAERSALASLAASSLLYERAGRGGELRFHMLETVREYALERLDEHGDGDLVRRAHAERYAAVAEAAEVEANAPAAGAWLALEDEHDNLRTAVEWSHDAEDVELELRLVGSLARFWMHIGHLHEAKDRLEAALRNGAGGPAALRGKAFGAAGRLALSLGDYERMKTHAESSLDAYRLAGDRPGEARALDLLATAVTHDGDVAQATSLHEQSIAIQRELGDEFALAWPLTNLGYLALSQGDYERATVITTEALELFERFARPDATPLPLFNLGLAELLQDRHDAALGRFRRGLELAHELAHAEAVIYCLFGIAAALAGTEHGEAAATLLGSAEAAADATGVTFEPLERRLQSRTTRVLTEALGNEVFAAAYTAGRQLTRYDAAAYALGIQPAAALRAT